MEKSERPLMRIERVWAMPNSSTFNVPPIGDFVRRYLSKSQISIDPYARDSKWATYTNDLNPNTSADSHMEAEAFLDMLIERGVKADLIIIDPPYSPRQVKECYDKIGMPMKQMDALLGYIRGRLRERINQLLTDSGTVLWFGWNTTGMGKKYGFAIREILLVCHGSDHNDTICFAEQREASDDPT